jgi:hypothetical protein
MQLLNLLKHPSVHYHNKITLRTDLGATYQEMMKSYLKLDELKKHQKRVAEHMWSSLSRIIDSKKPRLDIEGDEEEAKEEEEVGGFIKQCLQM